MSRLLRAVYWLGTIIINGFVVTWIMMGTRSTIGTVCGIIAILLTAVSLWHIYRLAREAERDEKPKSITINVRGIDD